ncbi:MAG: glycosyltransferase family 4 protein [Armatimonadetes bacterium]|nr:glycosyltransferase family 4 protein [Armatimonadota bacterium]
MTADTVGGVWTYALELARALAPHGVRVALATMGAPLSASQREEAAGVPSVTVHSSRYKLEWMDQPWEDVARAGDWLLDLERRVRPDVVHLNGYAHGALPWRAPVVLVGHSCVLSWWRAVKGGDAPADWDHYRQEVTAGLRAADLILAPTRAMRDALDDHYGPLPPSRVVPNGRTPSLFPPHAKEPFVLSAGRLWDEAKNVGALAWAAGSLPWPVCVAGDARGPEGGMAQFANVELLGVLPPHTLAGWLGRAAIYALPARYEPFGLSVLEAGLAGCALVLGDIPSLREVWGDAAVFVPPDDVEALRGALHGLISDEERRRAMAGRARERALTYTPERMAAGYLAAYQTVMRAAPSPGVKTPTPGNELPGYSPAKESPFGTEEGMACGS